MRFPAISLWQPYASLPLLDLKPWETRNRPYPPKYHGQRIVVASTKAFTPFNALPLELDELCSDRFGDDFEKTLPRGQALYSIVLKGCERTEYGVFRVPPELRCTGDFTPGRWMWEWGDVEPFNPFPIKGGQGWWFCDVPDEAWRCERTPASEPQRSEVYTPPVTVNSDPSSFLATLGGGK